MKRSPDAPCAGPTRGENPPWLSSLSAGAVEAATAPGAAEGTPTDWMGRIEVCPESAPEAARKAIAEAAGTMPDCSTEHEAPQTTLRAANLRAHRAG